MRIKVIGSAAGGGFPQWNCACQNCAASREGLLPAKPRTQTQLACEVGTDVWLLIGASPDLGRQIEREPSLWARPKEFAQIRNSPIAAVILTSAEIDAAFGLLLLREFQQIAVYSTPTVRWILTETNAAFRMLQRVNEQIRWHEVLPNTPFKIGCVDCELLELTGKYPDYVSPSIRSTINVKELTAACIIKSKSNQTLFFAPSIGGVSTYIKQRASMADVLLWDGTFWENNELAQTFRGSKSSLEMGHLPIWGEGGTLDVLQNSIIQRRFFIHMNNTNPILDETSRAFHHIQQAGWNVAFDGLEFFL